MSPGFFGLEVSCDTFFVDGRIPSIHRSVWVRWVSEERPKTLSLNPRTLKTLKAPKKGALQHPAKDECEEQYPSQELSESTLSRV